MKVRIHEEDIEKFIADDLMFHINCLEVEDEDWIGLVAALRYYLCHTDFVEFAEGFNERQKGSYDGE